MQSAPAIDQHWAFFRGRVAVQSAAQCLAWRSRLSEAHRHATGAFGQPHLAATGAGQLDRLSSRLGSFLVRLERLLKGQLHQGSHLGGTGIRELNMSPRTFAEQAGSVWHEFSHCGRSGASKQAESYLRESRMPLIEIPALLLGFANQTSFHHAFKRWTENLRRIPPTKVECRHDLPMISVLRLVPRLARFGPSY